MKTALHRLAVDMKENKAAPTRERWSQFLPKQEARSVMGEEGERC